MAGLGKMLGEEIRRLARKEVRASMVQLKRGGNRARKVLADLRARVASLEKESKLLGQVVSSVGERVPAPAVEESSDARITAKGVRSMRRKLGLSRELFAKLLNATAQTVYNWEKKGKGALRMRDAMRAQLLRVRGLGRREALAELGDAAKVRRGRAKAQETPVSSDVAAVSKAPAKRGRPRKAAKPAADVKAPAKRGRPRKVVEAAAPVKASAKRGRK